MKVRVAYTVQLPDEALAAIARLEDFDKAGAKPGRLASREEAKDFMIDNGLRGLAKLVPPSDDVDPDVIDAVTDLI